MKKFAFRAVPLLIAVLFGVLMAASTVTAADLTTCEKCHNWALKPDSDPNKFILRELLDRNNPLHFSTVDKSTCKVCHNPDLFTYAGPGTYTHQGVTLKNYTVNGVVYGAFLSQESIYKDFGFLHNQHTTPLVQPSSGTGTTCSRCHYVVACNACHVPVAHEKHYTANPVNPSTGNSIITPNILSTTGKSVKVDGKWVNYTTIPTTCAAAECHLKLPNPVRDRKDGSDLCFNCHKTADLNGHDPVRLDFAHDSFSNTLIIGGISYIVSCEGCHVKPLTAEHKKVAVKYGQETDAECGYCHGDSVSDIVKPVMDSIKNVNKITSDLSVKASNRACSKCHFDITVLPTRPSQHVTWHRATLSNNLMIEGSPHENCNTCHANMSLYATIYNLAKTPINNRNYDCFVCHNLQYDLAPVHMADFVGERSEVTGFHSGCDTCHTPGTETANIVKNILTDGRQQSYSCSECHNGTNLDAAHIGAIEANCTVSCHKESLIEEHISNFTTDGKDFNCVTCHNSAVRIEARLAIATGNTNCAACHFQAHNLHIVQQVPEDIPLHSDFAWSIPQPAGIWATETWMPEGYDGGKLIISNRKAISASTVWNYYKTEMADNGWNVPADPDLSTNFFTVEFTKGKRKATIFYYGGENHNLDPGAASYRIEILYI